MSALIRDAAFPPMRASPFRHGSLAAQPFPEAAQREKHGARRERNRAPSSFFMTLGAEYNHPEVGHAAVKVLEAAGYRVRLAEGRACCGRPLITGGQADRARSWVDQNLALLAPLAAQGTPILGLEPSCILTLRDEYLELASNPEQARIVAANAFTFDEFIARASADGALPSGGESPGPFSAIWRERPGTAFLHGHCHQKALIGNDASIDALRAAGYAVELIDSGCCGMAGDFGYGVEHYEVSRTIGEDRLFPAVKSLPEGGAARRQRYQLPGPDQAVHRAVAPAHSPSAGRSFGTDLAPGWQPAAFGCPPDRPPPAAPRS